MAKRRLAEHAVALVCTSALCGAADVLFPHRTEECEAFCDACGTAWGAVVGEDEGED